MLAKNKIDREEQLINLLGKMSELCKQYEAALHTLIHDKQNEEEMRKIRRLNGIAEAKARGVRMGRKTVPKPQNFAE